MARQEFYDIGCKISIADGIVESIEYAYSEKITRDSLEVDSDEQGRFYMYIRNNTLKEHPQKFMELRNMLRNDCVCFPIIEKARKKLLDTLKDPVTN